ncbi:4Fe-4S binding protein [Rhizobium wenxiniae]|uniref:4Fe-4S dicluster domain-containing protein n=1 Tax=Rhizobium wenxiniae TaxID=1737357 RepID=UPI001C6EBD6B|nr:4Fe-4S dicluster-binding protein [Rhizobium wenxiniae]MBW9088819.1 4Fe-4S binding protein [Rhizobium wenxiniae]
MAFLKILFDNLREGPATEAFPFGEAATPDAYRGKVTFDETNCVGCNMCEHVCAGGAIRFSEKEDGLHFLIWHNTCISCGLCAHYCPTKAIKLSNDWHLSHLQEEKYEQVDHAVVPYRHCTSCGERLQPGGPMLHQLAFKGTNPRSQRLMNMCPDCRRKASYSGEAL